MAAVSAGAPALEAKMEAILGKVKLVEDATQKAAHLPESIAALDGQISRVVARMPLVEKIEGRLTGLNTISTDVDRRLGEQLARRAELDALKASCDGLGEQMADASTSWRTFASSSIAWCRSSEKSIR